MKFIIRTLKEGTRISIDEVAAKRKTVQEKILAAGFQYLETEATLGSYDAMMERVEEHVYIIEAVTGENYV